MAHNIFRSAALFQTIMSLILSPPQDLGKHITFQATGALFIDVEEPAQMNLRHTAMTSFNKPLGPWFMYEKPVKGKKKCGCWRGAINCWRHSLEKVWIKTRGSEEAASKLVEFFKKEKISGKIECFVTHLKPQCREYELSEDSDMDLSL